ncbi:hypothetical protein F5X96DRAFT_614860 [Biscogniauxia mediterranea]|nr:hypothetical protein F5X96DRAFT_614860 [Biscogniauxia mediterranea]
MAMNILSTAAVSALFFSSALGQQLSHSTFAVTECFRVTSQVEAPSLTPAPATVTQGISPGAVAFDMPPCAKCDCATCTITSIYTTEYSIFCSTGIMNQQYTITKTYVGMSSLPTFATTTEIPFGFVKGVETCTHCGPTPITATMIYPATGRPYMVQTPTPASATSPPSLTAAVEVPPVPTSSSVQSIELSVITTEAVVTPRPNNTISTFSTGSGNSMTEAKTTTATANTTTVPTFTGEAGLMEGPKGLAIIMLMLLIL